jgi:lipid II:glycine glycyltransferase (peptidoglycan interpeptide bridge formation enzyme)
MTLNELKKAFEQFPEHYVLFAVLHEGRLAAASIAIKIKENILYNFYSAHPNDYNHLSPVVMLIEGMYEFCQQNNVNLLDLGTSALEGKPNFSLLDFKLRLGAKPYAKLTFEKNL